MTCNDVRAALSAFESCAETPSGARVATHCLYPSLEPVDVYVARYGDGFRVHDDGGAYREAWLHGREDGLVQRMLTRTAERYQVSVVDSCIVADAKSQEWLPAAIVAVANAAA